MATLKTDNIDSTSGGNVEFVKDLDVGSSGAAKNAHVYGTLTVDGVSTLNNNLTMGVNDITCGDVSGAAIDCTSLTVGGVDVNTGAAEGLVLLYSATQNDLTSTFTFPDITTIAYGDYLDFKFIIYNHLSSYTTNNEGNFGLVSFQMLKGSTWTDLSSFRANSLQNNYGGVGYTFETNGISQAGGTLGHLMCVAKQGLRWEYPHAGGGGLDGSSGLSTLLAPSGPVLGFRFIDHYGPSSFKGEYKLYGYKKA